jgi:LytS/YehU family sensor histidine kinase
VALIGQLTGVIGITPDYEIFSGYWMIVRIPLIAACVVANLVALVRRRKKLGRVQRVMFLACFFALDYMQIILMELLLISELVRRYLEQAQEAARQRMRNAIAQMRPHFIHNTMMTIYYLCEKDPGKAQEVTLNFANYLQSNFLAIAREGTIPFTEELEHTRAYLEVEQARFSGQLFVEVDTPITFFEIPPLTLQPLVENAIKHGLDPDLDPLYVSILTRETEKAHEIIVEDTGPGFVPAGNDDPYITLNNIRERLKTMCQGTLEIEPRKAGGTKVTIRIPMKKQQSI